MKFNNSFTNNEEESYVLYTYSYIRNCWTRIQ